MVLLVLLGVVGACIGAWTKPRPLALPAALVFAVAVRALIGVLAPISVGVSYAPSFARVAFDLVQDPSVDYVPLIFVTGGGALFALLLALVTERRSRRAMTIEEATRAQRKIRQGKFVRARGMVETRGRQSQAEARQRAILGPIEKM